ncbi:MAG TPA: hypothetical protein DIS71_03460 [Rhodobacter sp.]|nr:hypothetical protein [Rhodobacter sp.]
MHGTCPWIDRRVDLLKSDYEKKKLCVKNSNHKTVPLAIIILQNLAEIWQKFGRKYQIIIDRKG